MKTTFFSWLVALSLLSVGAYYVTWENHITITSIKGWCVEKCAFLRGTDKQPHTIDVNLTNECVQLGLIARNDVLSRSPALNGTIVLTELLTATFCDDFAAICKSNEMSYINLPISVRTTDQPFSLSEDVDSFESKTGSFITVAHKSDLSPVTGQTTKKTGQHSGFFASVETSTASEDSGFFQDSPSPNPTAGVSNVPSTELSTPAIHNFNNSSIPLTTRPTFPTTIRPLQGSSVTVTGNRFLILCAVCFILFTNVFIFY